MSKTIEIKDCQECPYLASKGQQRTNEERYFLYKCSISNHVIKDDFFDDCNSIFRIPKDCPL